MTSGTSIDFSRTNLSIENAICEIIDNSRDSCFKSNTKKIHVVFEQGVKKTQIELEYLTDKSPNMKDYSKSFSIAVYDNGRGFSNEKELHAAFQIIQDPKLAKKRTKEDTGKFHLGMKEATLNRFHHFSLITKIGSDLKHRSIRYPGEQNSCLYDWDAKKVNENPSESLPTHLNLDTIKEYMKNNKMKTCAHMSAARKPMTTGPDDYPELTDFIKHMRHFIGIAYQKDLANGKFDMKIGISSKMEVVEPVDLFWSEATPTTIKNHPKKTTTPDQTYICEEMYGYGVLSGIRTPAQVMINGTLHPFYVTPYLVPADVARKEFNKVTTKWGKSTIADIDIPEVSSSGKMFGAANLQGYTFVRNGRTIIIGNMLHAENDGFYGVGVGTANVRTRIRIKIEYDSNPGLLDHVFKLLPNKDGYEFVTPEVWAAVKVVIENNIDGIASKNFDPHNKVAKFFGPGKKKDKHYHETIGIGKILCKTCKKVLHEKGTECPRRPCNICSKPMHLKSCTPKKCAHKCAKCGVTGHLKAKCPKSKCPVCKVLPCSCCITCKKSKCVCPPPSCPKCTHAPCTCPPDPFEPGNYGPQIGNSFGDQYGVEYYPAHKPSMITLIQRLMKDANIKKTDL